MNAKNAMVRLLWKEYRLQRAFWICMVLFALMLCGLMQFVLSFSPLETVSTLFGIAIVIPAFYALGCGATMFSMEHEAGTYDFQRSFPVSSRLYFFTHALFGLASTAAMIGLLLFFVVILYTSPAWLAREPLVELPERLWPAFFGVGGVGVLELFVWGIFFSLILKRPLVAAILGVAVASIGVQVAITVPILDASLSPYLFAVPGRLAIVALVAAADTVLGSRWFHGENALTKLRNRKTKTLPAAIAAPHDTAPIKTHRFLNVFTRLSWQQTRQSAWMWIWFFAALIVWLSSYYLSSGRYLRPGTSQPGHFVLPLVMGIVGLGTVIGLPLLGIYVFYPDQQRRKYHFFTERGARPGQFWWSRQLAGFAIPFLMALICYFALIIPGNLRGEYPFFPYWESFRHQRASGPWADISPWTWLAQFGIFFDHVLIIYCVGQFWAMFIRSGILAMFFSLILSGLLMLWTHLMMFWEVPWWWSIALWPILLLLATRLRTSAWLLERRGPRAWLRPAAVLLPMLAILIAVPCYRVFSIPVVEPGFSPEQFIASYKVTPEALKTVAMYQRAQQEFGVPVKNENIDSASQDESHTGGTPDEQPWKPFKPLSEYDKAFVMSNRKAIELAIEASKRPECDFYSEHPEVWNPKEALNTWVLFNLVVYQAELLEAEGKLDAAWEYYRGALRIGQHLNYDASTTQFSDTRTRLYPKLVGWSARPGQTPERIRAAIKELDQFPIDPEQVKRVIKSQYLVNRAILSRDRKVLEQEFPVAKDKSRPKEIQYNLTAFTLWEKFLPWEKYRALRILNAITAYNMQDAERLLSLGEQGPYGIIETLNSREPDFALRNQIILPLAVVIHNEAFRWFNNFRYQLASRNAARVAMALEAWKIEHGAYPKTLEELTGTYFEKLPRDPFNGRNFRYFSEGLPVDLKRSSRPGLWISGDYDYQVPYYLPANQPFLWSVGPQIMDSGRQTDNSAGTASEVSRYAFYPRGAHASFERFSNEEEVWKYGLIFPLP